MAFDAQEQEIIRAGVAGGRSRQEVEAALMRYRTGQGPIQPQPQKSFVRRVIEDIPSDVSETVSRVRGAVEAGADAARVARARVEAGQISPLAGTVRTIGGGLGAGARALGEAGLGVAKLATTPEAEQAVSSGVESAVMSLTGTEPAQDLISLYQNLSPEAKAYVDGALGGAEAVLAVAGAGQTSKLVQAMKGAATRTARGVAGIAERGAADAAKTVAEAGAGSEALLNRGKGVLQRVMQEPIPQKVETSLARTTRETFDNYADAAVRAATDPKNATPLEVAGERAVTALDQMNRKLADVAQSKRTILSGATGETKVGNIAVKFRQQLNQLLDGQLSNADKKFIEDIYSRARALGDNPNARQVDELVDYIQANIYNNQRTLTVDTATDAIVKRLRGMTGQLNSSLKNALPESYKNLNDRYARIVDIRNELNTKLGKEAEKGGALMKRVFSPSDANTKQLFADVLDETGIDLVDEATVAKYLMEVSGDARQASLLEQLNLPRTKAGIIDEILGKIRERFNTPESLIERARQRTPSPLGKGATPKTTEKAAVEAAAKLNVRPEKASELAGLIEQARKWKSAIDADVAEVAAKIGGAKLVPAPLKGHLANGGIDLTRAMQKYAAKGEIRDLARNTLLVNRVGDANRAVELLAQKGYTLSPGKNYFKNPSYLGYRGINISEPIGKGGVEIQVQIPEILYYKNAAKDIKDLKSLIGEDVYNKIDSFAKSKSIRPGRGHEIYEQVRQLELIAKKEGRMSVDDMGVESFKWTSDELKNILPLIDESNSGYKILLDFASSRAVDK